MSNKIHLKTCEFRNFDREGLSEVSTYGFRIYDDYATYYNNTFSSMEDVLCEVETNLEELVASCNGFEDVEWSNDIGDHSGMFVNDEWIELV